MVVFAAVAPAVPITWPQIGVLVAALALLVLVVGQLRAMMTDFRTELGGEIEGLQTSMNGLSDSLHELAQATPSRTELLRMQQEMLVVDRRSIRNESKIVVIDQRVTKLED